jgi:hypothetical protein
LGSKKESLALEISNTRDKANIQASFSQVVSSRIPGVKLDFFDVTSDTFLSFTRAFLDTAKKLILLTFLKKKIVIGELGIFLFQFALGFVPAAFHA